MAAPLPLRTDFTASDLRHWARRTRDANQARRLLALARLAAARTRHGAYGADARAVRALIRDLKARTKALCERV